MISRLFGDFRFDYLKYHTHDIDGSASQCPICQLATKSTKKFLEEEDRQRQQNKQISVINRVIMRYD